MLAANMANITINADLRSFFIVSPHLPFLSNTRATTSCPVDQSKTAAQIRHPVAPDSRVDHLA